MVIVLLAGCDFSAGDKSPTPDGDSSSETTETDSETTETDSGTTDTGGVDPVCTELVEPPCVDEMILDLSLHDDKVSDGEVANTVDGTDFVTTIDASAGGYNQAANNPWVYIRFTAEGAERVDIDDETALESADWDMSLRRYLVRLNGGDSGPSCVGAAAMLGFEYPELIEVPEGITFQMDNFYTDDCGFINDSSGLEGSPQVAMSPWWEYPGCVATTGTPFLLQQADGHVLKLVIESYYDEGQEDCNENGSTTGAGGYFVLRWAYV